MGGPVASLLDTQLTASSFASLPAPPPPHCRSQHRPTAAPPPTLAAHASPPLPAQREPVAHPRSSWQADTGVWSGGRMAALPGAQPAQRSAGPKRAAWQRALFRFPIPNQSAVLRRASHTLHSISVSRSSHGRTAREHECFQIQCVQRSVMRVKTQVTSKRRDCQM